MSSGYFVRSESIMVAKPVASQWLSLRQHLGPGGKSPHLRLEDLVPYWVSVGNKAKGILHADIRGLFQFLGTAGLLTLGRSWQFKGCGHCLRKNQTWEVRGIPPPGIQSLSEHTWTAPLQGEAQGMHHLFLFGPISGAQVGSCANPQNWELGLVLFLVQKWPSEEYVE